MNKKLLIQITVIVIALGGAAWVLYNGFKDSGRAAVPVEDTAKSQEEILPNGNFFDFKVVDPDRFKYGLLDYPKLDPKNEVGIPEYNLITPAPEQLEQ